MTSLGASAHIFARPGRREELIRCFDEVLGCGPVETMSLPGFAEPMLLVRFPGGGHLSIEFRDDAPDEEGAPRLGAWLELRTADPEALWRAAISAGLTEVKHPGHAYYFTAPGGQVFTLAKE